MFSAVRAGTNLVPQLASGLRLFSKSVTMKSIFDTLNSNHIYPVIPAIRRDRDGTNYSRFLRKNGAIPGVLYGSDGNGNDERILIAVPTNEVDRFIKRLNLSLECTLFHLDLEGERILCFPRQLSWHPGSVLLVQLCDMFFEGLSKVSFEERFAGKRAFPLTRSVSGIPKIERSGRGESYSEGHPFPMMGIYVRRECPS